MAYPNDFPTSLNDHGTNNDVADGVDVIQAADIDNLNAALDDVEGTVGVTGSAVAASHDYRIAQLEAKTTGAAASLFGARTFDDTDAVALTKTTIYLAQCDGYLAVTGGYNTTYIYSDSDATPDVVVAKAHMQATDGGALRVHLGAIILAGDYVQVVTDTLDLMNWVPIGTGGLVDQT